MEQNKTIEWEIIAGESVGELDIRISFMQLRNTHPNYKFKFIESRSDIDIYYLYDCISIFVERITDKIVQIGVFNNFAGKFNKIIGLGNSIGYIKSKYHIFQHEDTSGYGIYYFDGIDGISVQVMDEYLDENDEWIEEKDVIDYIWIFSLRN